MDAQLDHSMQMFSGFIRNARRKKNLSQVAAAEKMGMDYRHYQNIECGKVNMRMESLFKILKFYDLECQFSPRGTVVCS